MSPFISQKLDYSDIGKQIRAARLQANLTQCQLAEELSYSDSYISKIERGTRIPLDPIIAIGVALNLDLNELFRSGNNGAGTTADGIRFSWLQLQYQPQDIQDFIFDVIEALLRIIQSFPH